MGNLVLALENDEAIVLRRPPSVDVKTLFDAYVDRASDQEFEEFVYSLMRSAEACDAPPMIGRLMLSQRQRQGRGSEGQRVRIVFGDFDGIEINRQAVDEERHGGQGNGNTVRRR